MMQHQYWLTKTSVFRKLGKKEDDCIVASDAELDAKLELFRSIQESCLDLQRIMDKYQERLCCLAQEENAMGRFLKEAGKNDKTKAGKMMSSVGKSLSYSGQQRLALRVPLMRLYQEVETFRHRAIEDTLQNVTSMEKQRTEYRASLNWMKNVSQELDPDTYKQMEKFRKVQNQVRHSKLRFDRLKLDCLQKIDLLAAARCNMFSHALILYQNALLHYADKASKTFNSVANNFKGYQHYEFNVIKELMEPANKLLEKENESEMKNKQEGVDEDKDKLLFFESEYHDEESQEKKEEKNDIVKPISTENENSFDFLLGIDLESKTNEETNDASLTHSFDFFSNSNNKPKIEKNDLIQSPVQSNPENDLLASSENDLLFLDQIMQECGIDKESTETTIDTTIDAMLGISSDISEKQSQAIEETASFFPSQLLDRFSSHNYSSSSKASLGLLTSQERNKSVDKDKKADWFNLFADLDPLADPDALGKSQDDRKC